jgi:hypothetical protein
MRAIFELFAAGRPEIWDVIGNPISWAALNPQPLPPRAAFIAAFAEEVIDRALLMQEIADALPHHHKMRDVFVSYDVTDNCGTPTTSLSVTSNEPVNGLGDGNTAPDWEIVSANQVRLRAERSGTGNGRIYTITITAADSAGGSSSQILTVSVPHN